MVSELNSGSSRPGSSPGWGNCVVQSENRPKNGLGTVNLSM